MPAKRLLVMDDEANFCEIVRISATSLGYDVTVLTDSNGFKATCGFRTATNSQTGPLEVKFGLAVARQPESLSPRPRALARCGLVGRGGPGGELRSGWVTS